MSFEEKLDATKDQVAGKTKEAQGKAKEWASDAKDALKNTADKAKEAVKDTADKAKDVTKK